MGRFQVYGMLCDWPSCEASVIHKATRGTPDQYMALVDPELKWLTQNRKDFCEEHREKARHPNRKHPSAGGA